MAKGSTYGGALLSLIFQAKPITSIGMSSGGTLANLWCALHRYDPSGLTQSDGGELSTSCGYTRVAATRSTNGWAVIAGNPSVATPAAPIFFPAITDRQTHLVNYFSIGASSAGPGQIFYSGLFASANAWTLGDIPELTTGSCVTEY